MDSREKRLVKLGFILLLPLLFLQLVLVRQFGEPFPAIMMPSFNAQEDCIDCIEFRNPEIWLLLTDGDSLLVDKHDLLAHIHLPQRNRVISRILPAAAWENPSPELRTFFRNWISGGEIPNSSGQMRINWKKYHYGLDGSSSVELEDSYTIQIMEPNEAD